MTFHIDANEEEFMWVQKYRPLTIDDTVLPEHTKDQFRSFVKDGQFPHLLISSNMPGTGKTTIGLALVAELGCDLLFINASKDNGIDILRNKVTQFVSTVSIFGSDKPKVVFLDEADQLSDAAQKAMKGMMEEFSADARFILTCNHKNNVQEPIRSRCVDIEFTFDRSEFPSLAGQLMARSKMILDNENVPYEDRVLAEVIMKHFPDNRAVIMALQGYSASNFKNGGAIDEGILGRLKQADTAEIMVHLRNKDFKNLRQWVAEHVDLIGENLYDKLYRSIGKFIKPHSVPAATLTLARYQIDHSKVASVELHVMAMLTELMVDVEFENA